MFKSLKVIYFDLCLFEGNLDININTFASIYNLLKTNLQIGIEIRVSKAKLAFPKGKCYC
jgi:hypothetical protein